MVCQSIQELAASSNGHITTGQAEANGISRMTLSTLTAQKKLVRIARGHYILADGLADEYALLQSRCPKAVFSLGTALYFWGLSDRVPHQIDITLPSGKNICRIRNDFTNLRSHYVKPDMYSLGITTTTSPMGSEIQLYDKERCICDLIHSRDKVDKQLYTQAIKEYFSDKPNTQKLIKYSKVLGVEDQVRVYMEVLL